MVTCFPTPQRKQGQQMTRKEIEAWMQDLAKRFAHDLRELGAEVTDEQVYELLRQHLTFGDIQAMREAETA